MGWLVQLAGSAVKLEVVTVAGTPNPWDYQTSLVTGLAQTQEGNWLAALFICLSC